MRRDGDGVWNVERLDEAVQVGHRVDLLHAAPEAVVAPGSVRRLKDGQRHYHHFLLPSLALALVLVSR